MWSLVIYLIVYQVKNSKGMLIMAEQWYDLIFFVTWQTLFRALINSEGHLLLFLIFYRQQPLIFLRKNESNVKMKLYIC